MKSKDEKIISCQIIADDWVLNCSHTYEKILTTYVCDSCKNKNNTTLSNFNSTIDKFFRQIDDSIPADMILKTGQN